VEHGPVAEETVGHRFGDVKGHFHVAIVSADPRKGGPNLVFGALKPLEVDVATADEGTGYPIGFVQPAGIGQDAIQDPRVKAEGA
jgi:hypothetical protein